MRFDCKTGGGGKLKIVSGEGSKVVFHDACDMMAVVWVDGDVQGAACVNGMETLEAMLQMSIAMCVHKMVEMGHGEATARAFCLEKAYEALYGAYEPLAIMGCRDA